MDIETEFQLLSEYMDMYIQILPYCTSCGGLRIRKPQLPTFEHFKQVRDDERYSLSIPNYKESKSINDKNEIVPVYTHGLGSTNGIGYRHYNFWMGCKFFTGGNIAGDYKIETEEINKVLRQMESSPIPVKENKYAALQSSPENPLPHIKHMKNK